MAMSTATVPEYRFQHAGGQSIAVVKRDDTRYRVTLASGEPVACTCPGFHHRGACKHLGMVAAVLARPVRLVDETIACEICGRLMPVGAAYARPGAGGVRFVCDACDDDLLLHVGEEAGR